MHSVARLLLAAVAIGVATSASAQNVTAFRTADERDPSPRSALDLPARFVVEDVPLAAALERLRKSAGVVVAYSPSLLPPSRHKVTCVCGDRTVGEALDQLLAATPAITYTEVHGNIVIYRREASELQLSIPVQSRFAGFNIRTVPAIVRAIVRPRLAPQVGSINGRVTDASTGAGISGANMVVEGTGLGVPADAEGRYRITNVPVGTHTLSASSIGYASATRQVEVIEDAVVTADFTLEISPTTLAELVVTATGEQRRVEIGNVIGRIEAEDLVTTAPVTNLTDLVTARVPGAQVILQTGLTGMSPNVRIRGINSISVDNSPLYIVDGVRINSQGAAAYSFLDPRAGFGQFGGRLNDLNPEEIESIDIVKGPSAATLYGTDAANGVVVIRTKRGHAGETRWTAYAEVGTVEPAEEFLDNYYSWGHDAAGNTLQCVLNQAAVGNCMIDSLTTFNQLENPATSPIGTGVRHQLGAQVRGGVQRFTYFFAGEHERETGYLDMPAGERERVMAERGVTALPDEQLRPNWLEKLSLRANVGTTFGTTADLNLSSGLVLSETAIPSGTSIFGGGEFGQGYRFPESDGWALGRRPGEYFAVRNSERVTRYTGSVAANWRPQPWLATRATVGLDISSGFLDALQRNGEGPLGSNRAGRRQNTRSTTALFSIDAGASAALDLSPRLSLRTSAGLQLNQRADELTSVLATGLPPGSETIAGAAAVSGIEQNNETVVAGGYLEEVVGIDDQLFITGAVRFDGGSSFGQDFRTAIYPKAAVSWLAVDRGPGGWLNTIRLRGAYGASGVQPGATDALTLYEVFTAVVNGTNMAGARPLSIGNPNLKPERQTEFEAGFDAELFDGRISLEATYYNRLSRDALIQVPLSPELGVASRWENIGAVRNTGIEGLLTARAIEHARFSWDVTLNGSYNGNELEDLGLNQPFLGSANFRNVEGYPLFGRWWRPILSYEDANGNGIIEPTEVVVGDEEVYHGTGSPPYQLTLSTGIGLFGDRLRISSLFDYRGGFTTLNTNEVNRCSSSLANCRAVNDPSAPFWEQARAVAQQTASLGSTWSGFIEDADFIRWRELSVSVAIPTRFVAFVGAQTAVLSLSGRNLALFTDYTGKDPEGRTLIGVPTAPEGFDDNPNAPQSRYWILRLTLGI